MEATPLSPDEVGRYPLLATFEDGDDGMVRRAVLSTSGLRLTLFHFAAGRGLPEHSSKARALVQILAGSCEFTVEGEIHPLKQGDLLHLPPGKRHALKATEPLCMLLTQVDEQNSGNRGER